MFIALLAVSPSSVVFTVAGQDAYVHADDPSWHLILKKWAGCQFRFLRHGGHVSATIFERGKLHALLSYPPMAALVFAIS